MEEIDNKILAEKMGYEDPLPATEEFLDYNEKTKHHSVNIERVANFFCEKYSFITIIGNNKEVLRVWNGKTWDGRAESLVRKGCELLLGKYAKINPVNEIVAKIKRRNHLSLEEFDKVDINLIPLMNGVYNLATKKIENYNPQFYFKTIIPINYIPSADCPTWKSFIGEALYEEDIPVLQEWFGFNLYRNYLIKKALIILGPTDTGKTKLINALTAFIGEENKTGLSLQKISGGTDFNRLSLKDKYANIYDDLSSKDLSDGGNFKIATGGGYISGEEKFGDYMQFKNYAKLTFATNKIPPVKDNDDMAYYSRWIVFRFDNVPDKKDLFLDTKIKMELSGILNWALEGLSRLLENGEFSYKKTPAEVKEIMETSSSVLKQFGEEALKSDQEGRLSRDQMYNIYCFWAQENKKPVVSKEKLGRNLKRELTWIEDGKDKERFWGNVIINPNFSKIYDTSDTFKNITGNEFRDRNDTFYKKDKDKNDVLKTIDMYEKKSVGTAERPVDVVAKKMRELRERIGKLIPAPELLKELDGSLQPDQIMEALFQLSQEAIISQPKEGFFEIL